jgi:hypothetical protein
MRRIFILLSLAALVFSTPVFAADISGNWQLDMTNQMGAAEKWDLSIKVDGNNLNIDVTHPNFGKVTGKGALQGDKVTMNFSLPGGIGPVIIDFEGTVKDNKMSGTRKVSYGPPTGGASKSGAPAGGQGGAPAGGQGGAPGGGAPPAGGQGGAPGGAPPAGGQGGAPAGGQGGAPGGAPPAGGQGGAPAGGGQAKVISDAWTAVKK